MNNKKIYTMVNAGERFEYSVEAGRADNEKHFDHHKPEHRNFASPGNNNEIQPIPADKEAEIGITHFDADTYLGVLRLLGKELPNIDLDLMEKIDLNGSSVVKDKTDRTLCYMVGIVEVARTLNFPRANDKEPMEVTELFEKIYNEYSTEQVIFLGQKLQLESEKNYHNNCEMKNEEAKVGIWKIEKGQQFDPSRPYEDGIDAVIVYREEYKSISIYGNPKSEHTFGGETFAGIGFQGHPKACGSPRENTYDMIDAKRVFKAVEKELSKNLTSENKKELEI